MSSQINILFSAKSRVGLVNAAMFLGHNVAHVDINEHPILDVLAEHTPSVMFIKGDEWGRAVEKGVRKYGFKLIVDSTTDGEWSQHGTTVDIKPAADTTIFTPMKLDESMTKFMSEYSYINAPNRPDSLFVMKMCYPIGIYNVRVYNHPLSLVGQYSGRLSREQLPQVLIGSTSIVTKDSDDELIYQIGACKGHMELEDNSILNDLPSDRNSLYDNIMEHHTYLHRLRELI